MMLFRSVCLFFRGLIVSRDGREDEDVKLKMEES